MKSYEIFLERATEEFGNISCKESSIEFSREVCRIVGRMGWAGLSIPVDFGGAGASHVERLFSIQASSHCDPSIGVLVQSVQLGLAVFLNASKEQKQEWLPPLCSGEKTSSICLTEPVSGSNLAKMETRILKGAMESSLVGKKDFIVNSHIADVHGVVARNVNGSVGDKFFAVIVPADSRNIQAGNTYLLPGLEGVNIGSVEFVDGCSVTNNNILSDKDGLEVAHRSITLFGKLNLAAVALGIQQKALDITKAYLRSETGKLKNLSQKSAIRGLLGNVNRRFVISNAACVSAAASLDRGTPNEPLILAAKTESVNSAIATVVDCMNVLGARGGLVETGLTDLLLAATQIQYPAGTASVNNKRLADDCLGAYREVGLW